MGNSCFTAQVEEPASKAPPANSSEGGGTAGAAEGEEALRRELEAMKQARDAALRERDDAIRLKEEVIRHKDADDATDVTDGSPAVTDDGPAASASSCAALLGDYLLTSNGDWSVSTGEHKTAIADALAGKEYVIVAFLGSACSLVPKYLDHLTHAMQHHPDFAARTVMVLDNIAAMTEASWKAYLAKMPPFLLSTCFNKDAAAKASARAATHGGNCGNWVKSQALLQLTSHGYGLGGTPSILILRTDGSEVLNPGGFNSSFFWADAMVNFDFLHLAPPFDADAFDRFEDHKRANEAKRHVTWWMRRRAAVAAGHAPLSLPGTCTALGIDLADFGRYEFQPDPEWLRRDPSVPMFSPLDGKLLERSPFQAIKEALLKAPKTADGKQQRFVDEDFDESEFLSVDQTYYDRDVQSFIDRGAGAVHVHRAKTENFALADDAVSGFHGGVDYGDINQGEIGNCWLIAVLVSALAAKKNRLFEEIVEYDDALGLYVFKLWHPFGWDNRFEPEGGAWFYVVCDDKVWVDSEGNLLSWRSKHNRHVYWPCLIEKVVAKLNGNFNAMHGEARTMYAEGVGSGPETIMHLLLGPGMPEGFGWDDPPTDNPTLVRYGECPPEVLFDLLDYGLSEGMLFTASTRFHDDHPDGEYKDCREHGLVRNHAYSIISTHALADGGGKLIKLRNNWGEYEWSGAFADTDTASWTDARKAEVNYVSKDDGIFYMTVQDFHHFFNHCGFFCPAGTKGDPKLAMFHDPECFREGKEYRERKYGLTW